MSGLEFTKHNAEQLVKNYLSRDVAAQRSETIRQLNLSSGERILDIGCGPGYLCERMGELVGRHGAVHHFIAGVSRQWDQMRFRPRCGRVCRSGPV